jgi:hypothetical protein
MSVRSIQKLVTLGIIGQSKETPYPVETLETVETP